MKKVLTIAIPTYNMEMYIGRCLKSLIVKKSNLELLEVLVINDGSKDKSSEIASRYQEEYPETIRVINKENGNYGSCINKALSIAKGKYFKILDADDWYDVDEFDKFISFLQQRDEDIVFSKYCRHFIKEDRIETQNNLNAEEYKTNTFDQFQFPDLGYLRMHCISIKTNILVDNHYIQQEGISYTDTEFSYFSIRLSHNFVFAPFNVYQYSYGIPGQTVDPSNISKNYNHFYKIGVRLVEDFIAIAPNCSEYKKQALLYSFYHLNMAIYLPPLFKLKTIDSKMKEMLLDYDRLISTNKDLSAQALRMRYYKIPFFFIWKYFHLRIGVFIGK